ncbi:MAG: hypothetical protein MUC63_09490 [Planctomycetes bacterium]|nr:hypothetical protein [Planctomycetota bacterium]
MNVLATRDIAQALSPRVSMEPDRSARGVDAAVEWIRGRLLEGVAVRLPSSSPC